MPEPLTGVAENAQLSFTEGSLVSAFGAPLLIKRGNTAAFQPFPTGRSTTLSLVPSTGNFNGTLTVTDHNPAAANAITKRTASFCGIIVHEPGGMKGGGWCLLPAAPTASPAQEPKHQPPERGEGQTPAAVITPHTSPAHPPG